MSNERRIDDLEGRMSAAEQRLDNVDDKFDQNDKQIQELTNSNIRLQTYMEVGFRRSDEQNLQIITLVNDLKTQQSESEKSNQSRHEKTIQMIAKGDNENFVRAQEGDRRNLEIISKRKWDAKATWLTVCVGCVAIAVAVILSL